MGDVVINLFPHFTFWKLQSLKQYLLFFLVIGSGTVIFYAIIQKMKKARTPEGALARVSKILRSKTKGQIRLYVPRKKTDFSGNLVAILPQDIMILHIEYFGYHIQGSYQDERWTVADNAETRTIPNPLPALQKDKRLLETALEQAKAGPLTVHTLIVFADNYAEPDFKLDDASLPCVVSTKGLGKWIRKHELHPAAKEKMETVYSAVSHLLRPKE